MKLIKNNLFTNSNGNSLVAILLFAVIAGTGAVMILSMGSQYLSTSSHAKKSSSALGENAFNLSLMSDKFTFVNNQKPVWYPVPYPTKEEILNHSTFPTIKVLQEAANGAIPMVKTSLTYTVNGESKQRNFVLDASRMASLMAISDLEKDAKNNSVQIQQGYFASGDVKQLSLEEIANFFTVPAASWPKKDSGSTAFGKVSDFEISFIKYIPDESSPEAIKDIQVSIQSNQSGAKVVTLANISVAPPPAPECDIVLKANQTIPAKPGDKLSFIVVADSITSHAAISADNEETFESLSVIEHQSIESLGTFNPIAKEIVLTVPSTEEITASSKWVVHANVSGPLSSNGSSFCQLEVPISTVPAPVCTLSAFPSNVSKGATTRLTLTCANDVTSAEIAGVAVNFEVPFVPPKPKKSKAQIEMEKRRALSFNLPVAPPRPVTRTAHLSYQKKIYAVETVGAIVTGPGGVSKPTTALGATCRFNDPDYQELSGEHFPENSKGLVGNKEISSGPYREYWYTGYAVSGNTRTPVSNLYTYWGAAQYGGIGISKSDCKTKNGDSICMYGGSCPGGNCWIPSNLVWMQFGPKESPDCKLERIYKRALSNGCFSASTSVLAYPKKQISVSQVREGQLLWNPVLGKPVRVSKVMRGPEKNALWSVTAGGAAVTVTFDHPFLTKEGMLQARDVKVGDELLMAGQTVTVTAVKKEVPSDKEIVWNFELEGETDRDHFVLADGLPAGDLVLQQKLKKSLLSKSSH